MVALYTIRSIKESISFYTYTLRSLLVISPTSWAICTILSSIIPKCW